MRGIGIRSVCDAKVHEDGGELHYTCIRGFCLSLSIDME